MIPLTPFGIVFVVASVMIILLAPRRWVPVALLIGVCYMVLNQGVQVGPFHFFAIRVLILAGLVRAMIRGERPASSLHRMDWLMIAWAAWALISSIFHDDPAASFVFNLGLAFNACGVYFLLRTFLQSAEDVVWLCRIVAVLLAPVAVEMIHEQVTAYNLFSLLGGVPASPTIREGRLRAQGPFAHAILAGTVGAVCLPLMIALWQKYRKAAVLGSAMCLAMVITSASSGPLLSSIVAIIALMMFPLRRRMRIVRWVAVLGYVALDLAMKAPAYYLMARIDLAGGSTGWHRAALIESSIRHLDEWWLGGTDYTRHWMPTGVSWNANHTDITNHYLHLGVLGGLPLLVLFVAILWAGFAYVGWFQGESRNMQRDSAFFVWGLGASLFAHAATSLSVAYFDQSFVFLYLTLAAIGAAYAGAATAPQQAPADAERVRPGKARARIRVGMRGQSDPRRFGDGA